jgi:predicted RNA-binding Zn-ribbon protein involved in translation (DUF1610 family)
MKIHSITTPIGSALLASIEEPTHPIEASQGWGLIFWGRCDRATFGQIILASSAEWIGDYDIKEQEVVIMSPPELAGKRFAIDTACVEATCPNCGSANYISTGINWRCKDCNRQWRKSPGKRGRPSLN